MEKDSQVRLMSSIYSQVMSTVVGSDFQLQVATQLLIRFWKFLETVLLITLSRTVMRITGHYQLVNLNRSRSGIGHPSWLSTPDHTSEEYGPFKSWLWIKI